MRERVGGQARARTHTLPLIRHRAAVLFSLSHLKDTEELVLLGKQPWLRQGKRAHTRARRVNHLAVAAITGSVFRRLIESS